MEYYRKDSGFVSYTPTSKIQYGLEGLEFIVRCADFNTYDELMPLTKIKFENFEFWALHQSEQYCRVEYGDFWQWSADAGMKEDRNLNIMGVGQTLSGITVNVFNRLGEVLDEERPDLLLVHGDTSTSFAATLAGFCRQIPVGHVEVGI